MTGLSRDEPAPGVVVYQPRRGFRYAAEPFLLGGWVLERHRGGSVLDVGTGSGVLALLLARRGFDVQGIDVLPEWIALARRSAAESDLELDLRVQDIRQRDEAPVDLAVCNPPYYPAGSGPLPADPLKAAGRHEIAGTLAETIEGMARAARSVALVLPSGRAHDAVDALDRAGRPAAFRCDVLPAFTLIEGRAGTTTCAHERVCGAAGPRVDGWYRSLGAKPKQ